MAIGYSKGYAAPEQKALVLEIQSKLQKLAADCEGPESRDKDSYQEMAWETETIKLENGTVLLVDDTEAETLLLNIENETETLLLPENQTDEKVTTLLDTTIKSIFVDNPEQQIDVRSDIYSLGATLYHLLSGRRLDDGHPGLTYEQLSELSSDAFAYILTTAMAPRKEDRFQSAGKMLEALNQIARLDKRYKKLLFKQRVELLISFTVFLLGIVLAFTGLRTARTEQEGLYAVYISQMEEAIAQRDQTVLKKIMKLVWP